MFRSVLVQSQGRLDSARETRIMETMAKSLQGGCYSVKTKWHRVRRQSHITKILGLCCHSRSIVILGDITQNQLIRDLREIKNCFLPFISKGGFCPKLIVGVGQL